MENNNMLLKQTVIVFVLIYSIGSVFAMDSRRANNDVEVVSPREQAIEIIKRGISDRDPFVRMHSIESIVLSRCAELYPLIEESLSDPTEPVRFTAALAVGDLTYRQASPKIADLYESNHKGEKIAAAYALLMLGDKDDQYHRILVQALQDSDSTLRANAALIMGKLGIRQYSGLLRWALQNKELDDKTRIQALESMAMLGERDIISRAWALLISKRADDRAIGIITMYRIGNYDATNAIKTMLEDEVLEVRLIAAARLEALGSDTGRDVIIEFFETELKKLSGQDRARALVHAIDAVRFSRDFELAPYSPLFLNDESFLVQLHAATAVLSFSERR